MQSILKSPITLFLVAVFSAAVSRADVVLTGEPAVGPPRATVEAVLHFTNVAGAPTTVVGKLTFDATKCTPLGGTLVGPAHEAGASFDYNVVGDELIFVAFGLGTPAFTTADSVVLYFKLAVGASGSFSLAQSGGSASNDNLDALVLNITGVSLTVAAAENGYHDADQDHDWGVSLAELLRIIQFYNSAGFHCQAGTEDGYAPGPGGDVSCATHDSDYAPQDWEVSLAELLRVIQFYNFVGHSYHPATFTTEDGFEPGPF